MAPHTIVCFCTLLNCHIWSEGLFPRQSQCPSYFPLQCCSAIMLSIMEQLRVSGECTGGRSPLLLIHQGAIPQVVGVRADKSWKSD
jgi:hypothetical protein